jgi:hypothetical protein
VGQFIALVFQAIKALILNPLIQVFMVARFCHE